MPILDRWDLKISVDDILRAQGGDPLAIRARRPFFVDVAEKALEEGLPLLHPVVYYRRLNVEKVSHERLYLSGGGKLKGLLVWEHLASASDVIVAVATVGTELEERAASEMQANLLYGLTLDAVGSAAVERLGNMICAYFDKFAKPENLQTSMPINPGMLGWSLQEGQNQIFSLLDAKEIDIQLHPSGIMSPRKSLSMLIGLGANLSDDGEPCDYCAMKERCRHRPGNS